MRAILEQEFSNLVKKVLELIEEVVKKGRR